MWIVEVVRCAAKGVDFQLREKILGHFLQQPVDDHASFDPTLRVQDEHDLGQIGIIECLLDDLVAFANIVGCVVEISLDKTLDHVEDDSVCLVVNSEDRSSKCERQAVDI